MEKNESDKAVQEPETQTFSSFSSSLASAAAAGAAPPAAEGAPATAAPLDGTYNINPLVHVNPWVRRSTYGG
jgi:hypothetical protein